MKTRGNTALPRRMAMLTRPSSSGASGRHAAVELGELVEKQHAVMRQEVSPRGGWWSAADERRAGDAVMRRPGAVGASVTGPGGGRPAAEWIAVQSSASSKVSSGRVVASRRAGIVRARRPAHQRVAPGRGDLRCPAGRGLAVHFSGSASSPGAAGGTSRSCALRAGG
jgi:hypothetical protein